MAHENSNSHSSPPFSYNSMKTTFGFLPMAKREQLARKCQEVRGIESTLPYPPFDTVCFRAYTFEVDDRRFGFHVDASDSDTRDTNGWRAEDVTDEVVPDDILCTSPMDEPLPRYLRNGDEEAEDVTHTCPNFRRRAYKGVLRVRIHVANRFVDCRRFDDVTRSAVLERKLIGSYLGKRGVIHVNHLLLESSEGVYRVPAGLKMRVRHLSTGWSYADEVMTRFEPLIDDASFPLETVTVCVSRRDDPVIDHHIFRSAKRVEVLLEVLYEGAIVSKFLPLTNRDIYFKCRDFPHTDIIAFVEKMVAEGREPGTTVSFAVKKYRKIVNLQNALVANNGAARGVLESTGNLHCVSIPMLDGVELNVYAYKSGSKTPSINHWTTKMKWLLKLEVMRAGSATIDRKMWERTVHSVQTLFKRIVS